MKGRFLSLTLVLAICAPLIATEPPQTPEAKQIVDLVNNAAALIEQKGKMLSRNFVQRTAHGSKGTLTFLFTI